MSGQTIVVSVLADTKQFASGMKSAEDSAVGWGSTVGKVGLAAVAVLATAAIAVGGFVAVSVKAAAEAEKISAQTEAVLDSTGGAAGRNAKQIGELATSLSRLSGVDDEVIQGGENMLLTFTNIQGVNFDAATKSALNMSVAMGTDMASSAKIVGKALNDPIAGIGALSKVGVQLTDDQKALIKSFVDVGDVASAQGVILGELDKQFGGSAEAFGNTFMGSIGLVKTAYGNIQEAVGGSLLPVLTVLNQHVADFLNMLTDSAPFQAFLAGIEAFGQGILDGTASFGDIGGMIQEGIQSAADWLSTGGIQTIVNALVSGREAFFGAALQVFPALVEALVSIVPQLVTGVLTLVTSLVSVLVSAVPVLLQGAITLFLGLVKGITAVLPSLITQIISLVPVLVRALVDMVPMLLQGAIALFSSLIQAVVTILPGLLTQIVALLPVLLTALVGLIPQLITGAISLFTALVAAVPLIIPPLIQAVVDLIPILITTLLDLIPTLLDAAVQLVMAIVDAIPVIIPALIDAVFTLIPAIITALIDAIPQILEAGGKLFGGLIDAAVKIGPKLLTAGGQVVQGLWDGISSGWNRFMSWWNSKVSGVVNTVKSLFGIASPSKVFAGIGRNIVAGLEVGLAAPNGIGALMSNLSDQVTGSFGVELATPNGYRSGGNTYEITVQAVAPNAEVGRAIVTAIDDYERLNGARP